MTTLCSDGQVVGETLSTFFTLVQASPIDAAIVLKNSGINTLNYRFQQWINNVWTDMGPSGGDYYNTLAANETKLIEVESSNPKVQMIGNASGGAFLEFSVLRVFERASGGPLPLMNL